MDGNIIDLAKARDLCDKYGFLFILDEAHAIGTLGKTGRGAVEYWNLDQSKNADVILGTFSKSFATVGGFVAADKK